MTSSWTCNCASRSATGLAPPLATSASCPRCERSRAHVELIEEAAKLLRWLDEGGPVERDDRLLHGLRAAVRAYLSDPPTLE